MSWFLSVFIQISYYFLCGLFYFPLFCVSACVLWPCQVFITVRGLSLVEASRGYFLVVCGLLIVVASLIEEHRF